jgi:hypothetical protein
VGYKKKEGGKRGEGRDIQGGEGDEKNKKGGMQGERARRRI